MYRVREATGDRSVASNTLALSDAQAWWIKPAAGGTNAGHSRTR